VLPPICTNMKITLLLTLLIPGVLMHQPAEIKSKDPIVIHVSPRGSDSNIGTAEEPLATIAAAQQAIRPYVGHKPVTVLLHGGTYYLSKPIVFTSRDSGTAACPVLYAAAPGERPIISGGELLTLDWKPFRDGILQAETTPGMAMDQLFLNGKRQQMARYPDYDPNADVFNGVAEDATSIKRAARWANPAGGYLHALHSLLWGDLHYRILGKKPDGTLEYEGGWQNNRPSKPHEKARYVENIFEELDAPGEWFYDAQAGMLYFYPPAGTDMKTAIIEVVRTQRHLVEFRGTKEKPAEFITLRGLTFCHTARTFMENREPVLRSDWTVYRGGAVLFDGAKDSTVIDCDFDQLGGNALFVNNYNRRITVKQCLITDCGANGIAFVGDIKAVRSPLLNYSQPRDLAKMDRTPGPLTDNYPADCLVEDCLITRTGRVEKQTAPVTIDIARNITIRHCSIYDVPRAGINIGDGCWGGHVVENCDVFETVLETGDHGSFNSWGRDRYWVPGIDAVNRNVAMEPNLPFLDAVAPVVLRNNRWRCDHGWDVDLDDGSTNYEIYNNIFLAGGLKLREGYRRVVTNNIIINNSLHPHCWFDNSQDVFRSNIVMAHYRPAGGMPHDHWGKEVDYNLFTSSQKDRNRFAAQSCDAHSTVADPCFANPAKGDFAVKPGSPALAIGFKNFPMDDFGVISSRLRAIARKPVMPAIIIKPDYRDEPAEQVVYKWRGSQIRSLVGDEYSAYGVSREQGGVLVVSVRQNSAAEKDGFISGDLIQSTGGVPVTDVAQMSEAIRKAPIHKDIAVGIVRSQQQMSITISGGAEPPRI
jgi:hypothetical protein